MTKQKYGDPIITLRVPEALIKEVEAVAAGMGISRSEAFRKLVKIGLVKSANGKAPEHLSSPNK